MKHLQTFENFGQAIGLDIKNEYSKLINDVTIKNIDLGFVDDVSQTDITNINQTYKDAIIKNVDGHFIMSIKEEKNSDITEGLNKELAKIESWLKDTTEEYDDWDWDGDELTIFNKGEKIESYSKQDLIDSKAL